MARLVRYPVGSGDSTLVEVLDDEVGAVRVSAKGGKILDAATTLAVALDPLRPTIRDVLAAVTDVAEGISQVEVTFGVRLHGELGAIVATGGGEANFEVAVTWTRPSGGAG